MADNQSLLDSYFTGQSQNARQTAVGDIAANPDDAARSLQLGAATGVDPSIVNGDVETFDRETRARLAGNIVENNDFIQDYINNNPLAARVSNDDYHNLDTITRKLSQVGRGIYSVTEKTWEGFREGSQGLHQPPGQWMNTPEQQEYFKQMPDWQARLTYTGWAILGFPIEVLSGVFGGVTKAAVEGSTELATQVTGDPHEGARIGREVGGMVEWAFNKPPIGGTGAGPVARHVANQEMLALMQDRVRPYVAAGVEPPMGIDPTLDKIKIEQAKHDLDALKEVMGDVQGSATHQRSPEMARNLIAPQLEGREVSIPYSAIEELYKGKAPHPEDGLLGWVPDLLEQILTTARTGGDIVIPMADWVAMVDKKVAAELHDNLRVRRGSPTIEEGKALSEAQDIDVYHGSPHTFDAFSMEKIGTGEGAQSYGHGLYFAENRGVAESYQNLARRNAAWTSPDNSFMEQPQGNMYRARIRADKEAFLDWDRPFEKQEIKNILAELKRSPQFKELEKAQIAGRGTWQGRTGEFIYNDLVGKLKDSGLPYDQARVEASRILNEAGIPGIRYLDQGSRGRTIEAIQADITPLKEEIARSKTVEGAEYIEATQPLDVIKYRSRLENEVQRLEQELQSASKERTYNYVLFDDSLIEILDRNGEAVNAVRQQAGLKPLADMERPAETIRAKRPGELRYYSDQTKAWVKPTELLTRVEKAITAEVDKILSRIAPQAERQGASRLEVGGDKSRGVYVQYTDRNPIILWALDSKNPEGTARHEAIHYLRRSGFFTPEEWGILKDTALKENWIATHDIKARYPDASAALMLEESIAEQFSKIWAKDPANVSAAVNTIFEKMKMALVLIKEAIERVIGHAPTADELFARVESGEIGSREGAKPLDPREFRPGEEGRRGAALDEAQQRPEQGELDVTRQEDKAIFEKANAIGMTVVQYRKYMENIAKQRLEDAEYIRGKALAMEQKRQTREWKENEARVKAETEVALRQRPDIAAAAYFRYGELYGEKLGERPKLNGELLTPEQRAQVPEHWLSKDGSHPDDVANLLGYLDVQSMLDRLQAHEAARGETPPGKFFDAMVKAETEKRMAAEYGDLQANILASAEDHILGSTQMDLLHEETVAMGMLAGSEISFTKADVQGWVETRFSQARAATVDTTRILNEAGKAGKLAELALLAEDFKEAFKQKQAQYYAIAMAKEAKKFDKEVARFERLAKRYSRREVSGVDQLYVDTIQSLLTEAGLPVRRSAEELRAGIAKYGLTDVQSVVNHARVDGWEPAVQDWITGGELRQRASAKAGLYVADFRDFHDALTSLNSIGRKVEQYEVAGAKADFAAFKADIIANLETLPMRTDPKRRGPLQKMGHLLWEWDAQMARMEEIVKDLDLRREGGPLFNALIRPMAEAKHTEYSMLEALSGRLKDLRGGSKAWRKTLDDTIPQDFLIDPQHGIPFDLTREHMINIMLNWGTESSIDVFTKAYFGKEKAAEGRAKIEAMFRQHAKKEDWEFVQNMIDIFKPWRESADQMYYKLSGVAPKWLDAVPMDHPHGRFEGGYWPIIHDQWISDVNAIKDKNALPADGLFGTNYARFTPGNSYVKERTGYVDYINFMQPIEQLAGRMQQAIHDISYRQQIMDAAKILKDADIRKAIRWHYGEEYEAQLMPWLQKIASHFNMEEAAVSGAVKILRTARFNLMSHALGASLKMLGSPDISTFNPKVWGPALANPAEAARFAHKNSKEIPHTFRNMDRDYRERLEMTLKTKGVDNFVSDAIRYSFWPIVKISQGFRIATFNAEFKAAKVRGMDDGAAAAHADSIVRERHGSAGLPDLPAIMTSSESMKLYTAFYGFQNSMYNWTRQIPGNLRRGEYLKATANAWGGVIIPSLFGIALYNQMKESDSWWKVISKGIALQQLSTLIFAREAANYFIEGFPQRTPLLSLYQSVNTLSNDIQKSLKGQRVEKPITHTANVIGLTTGLPLAQAGRTAQFISDVNNNRQRPRNAIEWMRGIIQGEARLKP